MTTNLTLWIAAPCLLINLVLLARQLNIMFAYGIDWWPRSPGLFFRLYGLPVTGVWIAIIAIVYDIAA